MLSIGQSKKRLAKEPQRLAFCRDSTIPTEA